MKKRMSFTPELDLHKRLLGSRKDMHEGRQSGLPETERTDGNTEKFLRNVRRSIIKIMAEMLNKKNKSTRKIFVKDWTRECARWQCS